jgi:transposase
VSHRNARLSVEGRRRLIERCQHRPIAHVAAEIGISRACASKWVNRWRRHGELGLLDRPSTPHHSPNATSAEVIAQIESWRRDKKWSASRITHELAAQGVPINPPSVTRHLARLGLSQRRFLDPCGDSNRQAGTITARWPGHMVHLDVKKVGRIPDGVAGGSTAATATSTGWSTGPRPPAPSAAMSTCTQSLTGSPGSPTPSRSRMRRASLPPPSWPGRRSGSPTSASPTSTEWLPTAAPATAQATSPGSSAPRPTVDARGCCRSW